MLFPDIFCIAPGGGKAGGFFRIRLGHIVNAPGYLCTLAPPQRPGGRLLVLLGYAYMYVPECMCVCAVRCRKIACSPFISPARAPPLQATPSAVITICLSNATGPSCDGKQRPEKNEGSCRQSHSQDSGGGVCVFGVRHAPENS